MERVSSASQGIDKGPQQGITRDVRGGGEPSAYRATRRNKTSVGIVAPHGKRVLRERNADHSTCHPRWRDHHRQATLQLALDDAVTTGTGRIDSTRASIGDPHPGSGLGLALTKRIVEAQGGVVGVVSAVGEGSTFFAEIPVPDTGADHP